MLSTAQCLRLHWVLPSLQQKLWLRPSRVHLMIPVMIRISLQRSLITSDLYREECLKSGLMNPKVLGVNIKTLIISGTGRYAFQHGFPVKGSRMQKTSIMMCWRRSREFVKTLVSLRLLHLLPRSLVHRLYLTF